MHTSVAMYEALLDQTLPSLCGKGAGGGVDCVNVPAPVFHTYHIETVSPSNALFDLDSCQR